jgi:hypothetical protein
VVVSRRRLNAKRLSSAVHAVLKNEQYRCAARNLQASMLNMDSLQRAADIVEDALRVGRRDSPSESHQPVCAARHGHRCPAMDDRRKRAGTVEFSHDGSAVIDQKE